MEILIVALLIILIAKEEIIELFKLINKKFKQEEEKPKEAKQEESGKMTPDEQFSKMMSFKLEDAFEKVRTK